MKKNILFFIKIFMNSISIESINYNNEPLIILKGNPYYYIHVRINNSKTKFALVRYSEDIEIYDIETQECLHTLSDHNNYITSINFNQDGSKIISSSFDLTIKIWDTETGKILNIFQDNNYINYVTFNSNGDKILYVTNLGLIKILDIINNVCLNTHFEDNLDITSVNFNNNETKIIIGSSNGNIKIWKLETDEIININIGNTLFLPNLVFNSDNTKFASSENLTINIWDSNTGDCLNKLVGHNASTISFNDNDNKIISLGFDRLIKIWNLENNECLENFSSESLGISTDCNDQLLSIAFEDIKSNPLLK